MNYVETMVLVKSFEADLNSGLYLYIVYLNYVWTSLHQACGDMYQVNKRYWKWMRGLSFENKIHPLPENSVLLVTYNAD